MCAKQSDEASADSGTDSEQTDNAEIAAGFEQNLSVFVLNIETERFHSASDVSDAHGTCKSIAVYLTEGLNLHGTGERNHGICDNIAGFWEKSNNQQQEYFQ